MPDGGGDFLLLQTAENATDGDMAGRGVVTLECHDGVADLAECVVDGQINNDAANHLRIFVPLAERHDGTKASAGAWIDVDGVGHHVGIEVKEDYTRVEGIRFELNVAGSIYRCVQMHNISSVIIDSCLFVGVAEYDLGSIYILMGVSDFSISGTIIRNNIIYGDGIAGAGIYILVVAFLAHATASLSFYNNTIDDVVIGIRMEEFEFAPQQVTLNVTLENDICTNCGTDFNSTVVRGTITGNNNCSEDDTGDDWDGAGSIINQNPALLFVTEGADHNLKAGSNALEAGKTIVTFDWDALHLDADNWRPQGLAWDMGALEKEVIVMGERFIWQGLGAGVKTAWDDGRNWINEAGAPYAQANYPGATPAAFDTAELRNALGSGAESPVGYDAPTAGDELLAEFLVAEDYNGLLATDGDPLILNLQATGRFACDGQSAGSLYIKGSGANGLAFVWAIASKTLLELDGKVGDCELKKGKITLAAGVTIAMLVLSYIDSKTRDAEVTIEDGATLPATVTAHGGKVGNSADITTLDMTNGVWTNEVGADIATVEAAGGTFNWDGGDITTLNCRGALVDASRSQRVRTATTITVGHGSILNLNDGVANIAWTTMVLEGGRILWPVGKSLNLV